MSFPVRHLQCGEIAYYFTRNIQAGEVIRAVDVRYLDGTTPNAGDVATCGHCHKPTYFGPGDIAVERDAG